jgi:hypothetical protein
VTFDDNGTAVCSAVPLNPSSSADCTVTYAKISGSPHTLVADYSGGANDIASNSNSIEEPVSQATNVVVTASPSPTTYGHGIVLKGSGLPAKATGTVSFVSSGTLLCEASV